MSPIRRTLMLAGLAALAGLATGSPAQAQFGLSVNVGGYYPPYGYGYGAAPVVVAPSPVVVAPAPVVVPRPYYGPGYGYGRGYGYGNGRGYGYGPGGYYGGHHGGYYGGHRGYGPYRY